MTKNVKVARARLAIIAREISLRHFQQTTIFLLTYSMIQEIRTKSDVAAVFLKFQVQSLRRMETRRKREFL